MAETAGGLEPQTDGWFVLNAADACWWHNDAFGEGCTFEARERPFPQIALKLAVLHPGQPNCMYHGENIQEDFLVLSGECMLLVEGEERPLKAWDFVHCPDWTEHVFVGAGEGPCTLLAIGGRSDGDVVYPEAEVALRHRAGVEKTTSEPKEAYAGYGHDVPTGFRDDWLPG
jgi:uncharacterized cupin superfamily protein